MLPLPPPTTHICTGLVRLSPLMSNAHSYGQLESLGPSGAVLSVVRPVGLDRCTVSCLHHDVSHRIASLPKNPPMLLLVTPPAPGSPYTGDVSRPPGEFTLWADSGNGSEPSGRGATAGARGAQEGGCQPSRGKTGGERASVDSAPCPAASIHP